MTVSDVCYSVSDDSARSLAMAISLITVMKEWGINRGGIDRQVSFAMKDPNKSSFKFIGNRFKKSNKVRYTCGRRSRDFLPVSATVHLLMVGR